jgi:hypothetical protein
MFEKNHKFSLTLPDFLHPKYPILCSRKIKENKVLLQEYSDTSKHRRYGKEKQSRKSTDAHSRCKTPLRPNFCVYVFQIERMAKAFKGYGRCALYCGSRLAGSKQGGGDIILRSNFVGVCDWNSRADGRGDLTELQECR